MLPILTFPRVHSRIPVIHDCEYITHSKLPFTIQTTRFLHSEPSALGEVCLRHTENFSRYIAYKKGQRNMDYQVNTNNKSPSTITNKHPPELNQACLKYPITATERRPMALVCPLSSAILPVATRSTLILVLLAA